MPSFGLFIRDVRERTAGHAERAEPTTRAQQVEGGTADASAHAVEDDVDAPHLRGQAVYPSRLGVIDQHAGPQLPRKLELAVTTRGTDHTGPGVGGELHQ
jgi:hypothetical protein